MEGQPAVSCICITYGRPQLLEEAIHSFLLQDYGGRKELIILNDYAGQTLRFDHPEVQVINCPRRFRTVGEKMNAAVALASHPVLFIWDDDDIYLPHRLRFSIEHFDLQQGFFKADKVWIWQDGELQGLGEHSTYHAASCWSRQLYDGVGGYEAGGNDFDFVFEEHLAERFPGCTRTYSILPEDIYYIYRWGGTGSYHLSWQGDDQAGENAGQDHVESFVRQQAQRGEIRQGRIQLQPGWKTDYRQLVASYLASWTESQAH